MRVGAVLVACIMLAACGASEAGRGSATRAPATASSTAAASAVATGAVSAVPSSSATTPASVTAVGSASPTGEVGYLFTRASIGPLEPVSRAGTPERTPGPEVCQARGLRVLAADGVTEVASVSFGPDCTVRVALAPGQYVVQLRSTSVIETSKALPQTVTIAARQTTELDVDIDTGIR